MANDARVKDFERFLHYFTRFVPGGRLHVIPFDECIERISSIARLHPCTHITPINPLFDDIGRTIYLSEEYREGVRSWRYFRKLNAFYGHCDPFIFFDVNSILLYDFRQVKWFDCAKPGSIYFRANSKENRTLRCRELKITLEKLGLRSREGYNMGTFASHGSTIEAETVLHLAHSGLRALLSKAPEQGFIAYCIGVLGLGNGLLIEADPSLHLKYRGQNLEFDGDRFLIHHENGSTLTLGMTKYTGTDFTQEPQLFSNMISSNHQHARPWLK